MGSLHAEVTLLLPVYNEADTIESVVNEFYEELRNKISPQIIIVEDGSTDGTKAILTELKERIPMNLVFGSERRGYSQAILEGLKHVEAKYVLFTDSDGQHTARDFWKLYEERENYDIINGWRVRRVDSTFRRLMSSTFQWLARRLFKLSFHDMTAPYKMMRSEVAQAVASEYEYMRESFWTEFMIRAHKKGFTVKEVPVTHRKRWSGSTRVYKPLKIPGIVYRQLIDILRLWWSMRGRREDHT